MTTLRDTTQDASEVSAQTGKESSSKDSNKDAFYKQRDEELRALCDKALPAGAARLFCLICKLAWFPDAGGFHKGRIGSLCLCTRRLARMMGANVKSFFSKKDPRTNDRRPGWIELLTTGGYIWVSRFKIPNIPDDKAMNVYNVSVLVPQHFQSSLPWPDGSWGGEATIVETGGEGVQTGGEGTVTKNGNSDFSASEPSGNREMAEKGTASGPKRALPVTKNGNSPWAKTVVGNAQKRVLPVGQNGNSPWAKTVTGCGPKRAQAVGQNGNGQSPETGLIKKTLEDVKSGDTETSSKRSTGLNALKAASGTRSAENLFLLDVGAMMEKWQRGSANAELANSGAWWRLAFRADADLMCRLLAELESMIKEGAIKETPGQAAVDLWKRWGGKLPEPAQ